MAKKVSIVLDGTTFEADLLEELAPKTCQAFESFLPLEVRTFHSAWSGDSIWFTLPGDKVSSPPHENVNIYGAAGDIMWHPGSTFHEFQLVHGTAQFRWKMGPLQASVFAKITTGLPEFDKISRRIQKEGGKKMVIKK